MDKFKRYWRALFKDEKIDLCKRLDLSHAYVSKAASTGETFSPVTCVLIERETEGHVTRKDLRPDDWMLIWPELIERK